MNPDGSDIRRLTYNPAPDNMPDLSRDGPKVVFVSKWSGRWEIHSMNVDGRNMHQLTTMHAEDQYPPSWPRWSPAGKRIAHERLVPGRPNPGCS